MDEVERILQAFWWAQEAGCCSTFNTNNKITEV
jgi:hypothetical protein